MKFKALLLIFNAILLITFLILFFLPLFLLGPDFSPEFWVRSWPLALAFLLLVGGMDWYFLRHRVIFQNIEEENWEALLDHWDAQLDRGRVPAKRWLRLYIQTALLRSRLDRLKTLEEKLQSLSPDMVRRFALHLGLPVLMEGRPEAIVARYAPFEKDPLPEKKGFLLWILAFGHVGCQNQQEAIRIIGGLVQQEKDPLIRLAALYLGRVLDLKSGDPASSPEQPPFWDTETERQRLLRKLSPAMARKQLERLQEEEITALLLKKIWDEALEWLASPQAPADKNEEGPLEGPQEEPHEGV